MSIVGFFTLRQKLILGGSTFAEGNSAPQHQHLLLARIHHCLSATHGKTLHNNECSLPNTYVYTLGSCTGRASDRGPGRAAAHGPGRDRAGPDFYDILRAGPVAGLKLAGPGTGWKVLILRAGPGPNFPGPGPNFPGPGPGLQ